MVEFCNKTAKEKHFLFQIKDFSSSKETWLPFLSFFVGGYRLRYFLDAILTHIWVCFDAIFFYNNHHHRRQEQQQFGESRFFFHFFFNSTQNCNWTKNRTGQSILKKWFYSLTDKYVHVALLAIYSRFLQFAIFIIRITY